MASVLSLLGPGMGGGVGYSVGEQVAMWLTRRIKWLSTCPEGTVKMCCAEWHLRYEESEMQMHQGLIAQLVRAYR